jgi:hypothetical protein
MRIFRRLTGNSESGIVLIVCLALLLMLSLIGIASIMTSNTEMDISGNAQQQTAAFYLADAGAERAMGILQDSSDWRYGFYDQPLGDGVYNVMVFDSLSLPYLGRNLLVRSTGTVEGAETTIEVILAPKYKSKFDYGAYGRDDFKMMGGGLIDSWDSGLGTYASQVINGPDGGGNMFAGDNARIACNGIIKLAGSSQVHGDAVTGPTGIFDLGGGLIGDTTRLATPIVLDSIPASEMADAQATNDASTNLRLTGAAVYDPVTNALTSSNADDSMIFSTGTYYFSSAVIKGTMVIEPGAQVFIYTDGVWDGSGGSMVNIDGVPSNLHIYSTGSVFNITGGSAVCAAVYAPEALITVSGGSEFYGSLLGREYDNGGGTNLHFDEALMRLIDEDFIVGIRIVGWNEL